MNGRPAEIGAGVAAAIAFLIAFALGLEDNDAFVWAVIAVLGAVPGAITWLVTTIRGPGGGGGPTRGSGGHGEAPVTGERHFRRSGDPYDDDLQARGARLHVRPDHEDSA